jgi:hypothetical protein
VTLAERPPTIDLPVVEPPPAPDVHRVVGIPSYRWYEEVYSGDMTVAKVSVSLDEKVLAAARARAEEEGKSLSAWLSALVAHQIAIDEGLAAVREYEAEYGPISEEARARARQVLRDLEVIP